MPHMTRAALSMAAMTGGDFLVEAQKVRLAIDPGSGDSVQRRVTAIYARPNILSRVRQAMSRGK